MNTTATGRSLELFFIDGRPDGMLTAEVFNWTGHVLMTPRTQLSEALRRTEAQYTGIYLLLGEKDGAPMAYIGEAEDVSDRIRSHDAKKDWWTQAILITSAANNLNKAHVKYLESRLVEEARVVGKIALENGNIPPRPGLSEAARANMEAFLDYILMILPALRIDTFLRNTRPTLESQSRANTIIQHPHFELISERNGVSAKAHLIDGEFVVQAGSSARPSWIGQGSEGHTYRQLGGKSITTKGAILIWGSVTPEGRISVMKQKGFHDILSIDQICRDLVSWQCTRHAALVEQRQKWCNELFSNLLKGSDSLSATLGPLTD